MKVSLFQSGLAPRLAAATLYAALAFGTVAAFAPSDRSPPPTPAPATSPAPSSSLTLRLDSIQPVDQWTVTVDGTPIAPLHCDAHSWVARPAGTSGSSALIEARPRNPHENLPPNAIRIRLVGTPSAHDATYWCERDWSLALRFDRLPRTHAPLESADLLP